MSFRNDDYSFHRIVKVVSVKIDSKSPNGVPPSSKPPKFDVKAIVKGRAYEAITSSSKKPKSSKSIFDY